MRQNSGVCMAAAILLLVAGCRQQERPETTAYRKAAEQLYTENTTLRHQANITTIALVITGCGLGASLFVLARTKRRS